MKIIGLCGKAYSGKNTAAEHIVKEIPLTIQKSIATPLKLMAVNYFKCTPEEVFTSAKTDYSRNVMQGIGDLMRKEVSPTFFLDILEKHFAEGLIMVIDDVRLVSEAEWILKRGGIVIKCICPNHPKQLEGKQAEHATESEIDKINPTYTVSVDYGEIPALQSIILNMARDYINKHKKGD